MYRCVNNHIRNRKGEFVKELAKLQSSMEGSSKRIEKLKQRFKNKCKVCARLSGVHMYRPCDTCPYVTLETLVFHFCEIEGCKWGCCAGTRNGMRVSPRGRSTAGVRRGVYIDRESEIEPRCRQAEHVYRRHSSRAENALEVGSPLNITAVDEVGVEVLDTLIGLQVTDGHGENVFRVSK